MPKLYIAAVALLAISAELQPANGSINLPTDGTWVSFDWFAAPHDQGDFTNPIAFAGQLVQVGTDNEFLFGPFEYSSSSPLLLEVVDVFENGDRFSIFLDGNSFRGETSEPANDGVSVGDQPEVALNDPDKRWSFGSFPLPAGTHEIFIKTTEIPVPPGVPQALTQGKGWLRASPGTSVPEPATIVVWAVLGSVFSFGFSVRRSRTS